MFQQVMTTQASLGQTLESAGAMRTGKLTYSLVKLVWMLGGHVVI